MTGTLALVGGAEFTDGCSFDVSLLEISGDRRVVVLPTAAAFENPMHRMQQARSWFASLSAEVEILDVLRRSDALNPAIAARVAEAPMLYLCGGSPMHLRSVLKDTPLWEAIVGAFRAGAVLAGAAEGATVLSTYMVDSRGGAFTVGLDLLDSITMIPRFNRWSEDKWHRTVRLAPAGMAVVGVDEATALIFSEGQWRSEGVGSVTAYCNGRQIDVADLPPLREGATS